MLLPLNSLATNRDEKTRSSYLFYLLMISSINLVFDRMTSKEQSHLEQRQR